MLGRFDGFVAPASLLRALSDNGTRSLPNRQVFKPRGDREAFVRFRRARSKYPEFVLRATQIVRRRADFAECQGLCDLLAFDSAEEVLVVLHLLARGALPAVCAPARVARTPYAMLDPSTLEQVDFRPQPCLVLEGGFFFFQVTLQGRSWRHRVDLLHGQDDVWSVVEMDGDGHAGNGDAQRDREIGLRTLRLTPEMVTAESFELTAELARCTVSSRQGGTT